MKVDRGSANRSSELLDPAFLRVVGRPNCERGDGDEIATRGGLQEQ